MTINVVFEHSIHISEHYIGVLPIIELVGSYLIGPNIFAALTKYLQEMKISLSDGRFFAWTY